MNYNLPSTKFHKSLFALVAISTLIAGQAYAQVDAGALQQGLEQQLPLPSPLALPEPGRAAPVQPTQPKEGELRFTVKSFAIEGVNILPEAEVQMAIRSWVCHSGVIPGTSISCIYTFNRGCWFTQGGNRLPRRSSANDRG